jgi:hypothetical protein
MPNILLTQRCVRACPYCFAAKHMDDTPPDATLSWEDLVYVADFLQKGGDTRFPMLGGEPTLHPHFVDFVAYTLDRGFKVHVFTSGVVPSATLDAIATEFKGLPFDRFHFICNLNDPELTPTTEAELRTVRRFLKRLGERVIPGFNIYRTDFRLDFLFDAINRYGLQRTLRLGLAHPIPGASTTAIRIGDIDDVIERLFSFRDLFTRMRVKPGLDCGFPMCRFSEEQLGWLMAHGAGISEFGCGPVLDIGPDLMVWPCFPLSSFHRKSLLEFDSTQQLLDHYRQIHGVVRTEVGGIYPECDGCWYREDGRCAGGCIGHSVGSFQDEARLRLPQVYM